MQAKQNKKLFILLEDFLAIEKQHLFILYSYISNEPSKIGGEQGQRK